MLRVKIKIFKRKKKNTMRLTIVQLRINEFMYSIPVRFNQLSQ